MAVTEPSGLLSDTIEDEERQPARARICHGSGRRRPDHGECLRARQFAEYDASSTVGRSPLDVNLCRWAALSGNSGLVLLHPKDGRRGAGVVFRRIRVYVLTLALVPGTEVFPAGSTVGVLVHVAWGKSARLAGWT